MNAILTVILGFVFAAILRYARLNKYDTISGLAVWEDLTIPKAIAIAIGTGMLLIHLEVALGWASFHIKPLLLGGVVLGGLIFGAGMAILGYCPGTLPVSAGEGSIDALTGILGGLLGGLAFTLLLPAIKGLIGPDMGKVAVSTILSGLPLAIVVIFASVLFIISAFYLHRMEGASGNYKWLISGVFLGILEAIVFHRAVSSRPIGASTAYPYVADLITGLTNNPYFQKISKAGSWEVLFLLGAFLGGLILSLVGGDFRFTVVHERWKRMKGDNAYSRLIWAFIGGFVLIFGARMAGGCTSGHILSGGIQLAVSSLLFMIAAFTGLLITGKLFYRA